MCQVQYYLVQIIIKIIAKLNDNKKMERAMRFELTTLTLAT